MSEIQERIAAVLRRHRQMHDYEDPVDECECGYPKTPTDWKLADWQAHIAEVITAELALTAEYGLHDKAQTGTADVDMWWTDDPSEDFVAIDAAREALGRTTKWVNHELVRRYITSWEHAE